jgi:hypothetical protein
MLLCVMCYLQLCSEIRYLQLPCTRDKCCEGLWSCNHALGRCGCIICVLFVERYAYVCVWHCVRFDAPLTVCSAAPIKKSVEVRACLYNYSDAPIEGFVLMGYSRSEPVRGCGLERGHNAPALCALWRGRVPSLAPLGPSVGLLFGVGASAHGQKGDSPGSLLAGT